MHNTLHCKLLLNEDLIRFLHLYSLSRNAAPNTMHFLVHSVIHIASGLLTADKNEIAVHWPSDSEMVNNNRKLCPLSCFSAVKIKVLFWWTHYCSRKTGNSQESQTSLLGILCVFKGSQPKRTFVFNKKKLSSKLRVHLLKKGGGLPDWLQLYEPFKHVLLINTPTKRWRSTTLDC